MYYRICDLNVLMDTFGITEQRAEKYRCAPFDTPDLTVVSHADDLKEHFPLMPHENREYISTGASFNNRLLGKDGIMIHSSAVVVDGRAYLFTADPGTGKSTHTELWLKLFGDRAFILNDDKPALRRIDGVWYVYGTPWSGKNDISENTRAKLGGIALLERGTNNEIEPVAGIEVLQTLWRQTTRPVRKDLCAGLMDNLDKLLKEASIWKLKCNMDQEAAIVSYEAMSGQKYIKENENEN